MNLFLKPLADINDPVWSVIILLGCGLAFTMYCVVYILRMSFSEMSDERPDE
jgi:hypothetical protein